MKFAILTVIFGLSMTLANTASALVVPYKCKIAPGEKNNNGVETFGYLIVYDLIGAKSKVKFNTPIETYLMDYDVDATGVVLQNRLYEVAIDKATLKGSITVLESQAVLALKCEANASIGR